MGEVYEVCQVFQYISILAQDSRVSWKGLQQGRKRALSSQWDRCCCSREGAGGLAGGTGGPYGHAMAMAMAGEERPS